MIVVARGERRGTWRIGLRCAGTLRLKGISSGYHHYYRVAGANAGCAALGVDCLKRVGAHMVDVFVPDSGPEDNINLRRVRSRKPEIGSRVRECLNCVAAAGLGLRAAGDRLLVLDRSGRLGSLRCVP